VNERGLTNETQFEVETGAGKLDLGLLLRGHEVCSVRVYMGVAGLLQKDIPVAGEPNQRAVGLKFMLGGNELEGTAVSVGNPHCVVFVDDVDSIPVSEWGRTIENDSRFPQKTNVHFVEIESRSYAIQRTWERGAGLTLACGTGACASVVAGVENGLLERKARVRLPGGELYIEYANDGGVWMTGPAEDVFDGVWP
jgi:diaminopimelate epimerase